MKYLILCLLLVGCKQREITGSAECNGRIVDFKFRADRCDGVKEVAEVLKCGNDFKFIKVKCELTND